MDIILMLFLFKSHFENMSLFCGNIPKQKIIISTIIQLFLTAWNYKFIYEKNYEKSQLKYFLFIII